MTKEQITKLIINCLKDNLEFSGEEVPDIEPGTEVFTGIQGFDSLRAIEVIIDLEEIIKVELPPEKVFIKQPQGSDKVSDIAEAIYHLSKQE